MARAKASAAIASGSSRALQQRDEALLPHAFELLLRKRRALRHIGHQRQRIGKPPDRHVQLKRRGIDAARSGEIGEQGVERVGDLDGGTRAGALR